MLKKVKSGGTCIATCCAILAATMAGGLSAGTLQSSYQLPSNAQVIEYLLQSVSWYRHVYAERQVANEPADLLFLDNNQAIEGQIVRLSFDFARVDATLIASPPVPQNAATTPAESPGSDLGHFIELKNRSDRLNEKALRDVATLKRKMRTAGKADGKKVKAALDDAQGRLELLHAVSQTVNDLVQFLQNVGASQDRAGSLDSTIDSLAESIPELSNPATPVRKLPAEDASSRMADSSRDAGLLGLASEVSALKRKLRMVDEKIHLTDGLALGAQNLRRPMTGFITQVLQSAGIKDVETSDLSLLRQQKSRLNDLTLQLKGLSPAIVALDKQKALLAEYKSHLQPWRSAVASEYVQAWKKLSITLLVIVLIIGLLIGISEVSRRLALRRVHDPNRRRIVSLLHRVPTGFAIIVVAFFGLATDLSSLATYFGLLTAGVAVALQNVILASLGYLLLVGKRGIRIGDRIQISGVTGDVMNMGLLQFQLREFDVQKQQFTGQVATFANSLVFVSPAIGLLKFKGSVEKTATTAVDNAAPRLDSAAAGGSIAAGTQK